jgi:roadblock/LC7 domain-containing protein
MSLLDDTIDVNDFGYQTRNDVNDFDYRIDWNKSGFTDIRNFRLSPFVHYAVNGDGYATNKSIGTSGELTFNNLFKINGYIAYLPQRYDDRNSFGNGTFEIRTRSRGELNFNTDLSKPVSFFGKIGYAGEAVYGTSVDTKLGVAWRPRHNLNMQFQVEQSDKDGWLLHQEDQNFTAFQGIQWQPQLNLEYFVTSKQQIRLAMQWVGIRANEDRFYTLPTDDTKLVEGPKPPGETDDFSVSQLNFQVRYRWQIAPLSDLFIVYTKGDKQKTGLQEFDELFRENWNDPIGDQLVIKLRYRLGS